MQKYIDGVWKYAKNSVWLIKIQPICTPTGLKRPTFKLLQNARRLSLHVMETTLWGVAKQITAILNNNCWHRDFHLKTSVLLWNLSTQRRVREKNKEAAGFPRQLILHEYTFCKSFRLVPCDEAEHQYSCEKISAFIEKLVIRESFNKFRSKWQASAVRSLGKGNVCAVTFNYPLSPKVRCGFESIKHDVGKIFLPKYWSGCESTSQSNGYLPLDVKMFWLSPEQRSQTNNKKTT